jgi:hypothetical protein
MNITEHSDDDNDDDNNIWGLFKLPHTSLKVRESCLTAITFVTTTTPMCHEWEFMLFSFMHWN